MKITSIDAFRLPIPEIVGKAARVAAEILLGDEE